MQDLARDAKQPRAPCPVMCRLGKFDFDHLCPAVLNAYVRRVAHRRTRWILEKHFRQLKNHGEIPSPHSIASSGVDIWPRVCYRTARLPTISRNVIALSRGITTLNPQRALHLGSCRLNVSPFSGLGGPQKQLGCKIPMWSSPAPRP